MELSDDEQIYKIRKGELRSSAGVPYLDFKRSLHPHYGIVWRDISLGYLGLISTGMLVSLAQLNWPEFWVLTVPLGAVGFGFIFAYLNLFMHEAAHTNLAQTPKRNDVLADWLIGIFFGQSAESYRVVHFGHHQHHGTPLDTEHSYFDPLNVRFFVGALFGASAFKVARKRAEIAANSTVSKGSAWRALIVGFLFNGFITIGAMVAGFWQLGLAWAIGMLSVFPFLNALRQLLEHRDELATSRSDFARVVHGRINRLFGDSALARVLGGAGFNRHLLHHWEPQVSYTRLPDLERFVMSCDCAPLFQRRQTTYTETFFRLLRQARA